MTGFDTAFSDYLNRFNQYISEVFLALKSSAPEVIRQAMTYAIEGGGKRIRPILCIATAEMFGFSFDDVKELALSIEMIHSYSLVHDDLPAMDNDDYRRGKLSTHKKFGEAYGILAGDALLNFAFEHSLSKENITLNYTKALCEIAKCAGYNGMIGGQVLDLLNEKNDVSEEVLYDIVGRKTSELLKAPLVSVSMLNGGKYYDELSEYGLHLGYLFQITDDILDVEGSLESIGKTPNKDVASEKLTAVKLFGVDGAKEKAKKHYQICKNVLNKIENSNFLMALTDKIYLRKN